MSVIRLSIAFLSLMLSWGYAHTQETFIHGERQPIDNAIDWAWSWGQRRSANDVFQFTYFAQKGHDCHSTASKAFGPRGHRGTVANFETTCSIHSASTVEEVTCRAQLQQIGPYDAHKLYRPNYKEALLREYKLTSQPQCLHTLDKRCPRLLYTAECKILDKTLVTEKSSLTCRGPKFISSKFSSPISSDFYKQVENVTPGILAAHVHFDATQQDLSNLFDYVHFYKSFGVSVFVSNRFRDERHVDTVGGCSKHRDALETSIQTSFKRSFDNAVTFIALPSISYDMRVIFGKKNVHISNLTACEAAMKYAYFKEMKALKYFWVARSLLRVTKWFAHLDVDEYLAVWDGMGSFLQRLATRTKVDVLYLGWLTMDGVQPSKTPHRHVTEMYNEPCLIRNSRFDSIKTISKVSSIRACCIETHHVVSPKNIRQGVLEGKTSTFILTTETLRRTEAFLAHYIHIAGRRSNYCKAYNQTMGSLPFTMGQQFPPLEWERYLLSTRIARQKLKQRFNSFRKLYGTFASCVESASGGKENTYSDFISERDKFEYGETREEKEFRSAKVLLYVLLILLFSCAVLVGRKKLFLIIPRKRARKH